MGVQVAEQVGEERELGRGALDDPRRRPPVVVGRTGAEQLQGAGGGTEDHRQHGGRGAAAQRHPQSGRAPGQHQRGGQREHRGRGQREEQRDGDVVRDGRLGPRRPDEEGDEVVPEVVVVQPFAGQPRVQRRERPGPADRVDDRHVHRLLGAAHVRREAAHHGPAGERDREDDLGRQPHPETRAGRDEPVPEQHEREHGEQADAEQRAPVPVRHDVERGEQPDRVRGEQEAERSGEREASAGQPGEQHPGGRDGEEPHQRGGQPEEHRLPHRRTLTHVDGGWKPPSTGVEEDCGRVPVGRRAGME